MRASSEKGYWPRMVSKLPWRACIDHCRCIIRAEERFETVTAAPLSGYKCWRLLRGGRKKREEGVCVARHMLLRESPGLCWLLGWAFGMGFFAGAADVLRRRVWFAKLGILL